VLGVWPAGDGAAVDVVGIAHAYDRALAVQPHAIVVDDSHPDTPEVCGRLRRERPATRILVLTAGHRERAYLSLCAGAFSVLDARTDNTALHAAIVAAARDEALLDMSSAAMLLGHLRRVCSLHDDPFVNIARLTMVEETVLAALAEGRSIDQVAAARGVTARAVSLHLGFAVRRLHQHTMVAAQSEVASQVLAMRVPITAGSPDTSR
jgi:DNA-binding NarL/FixJ family response regulator